MDTITLLLLLAAAVCFALVTLKVAAKRVNLLGLGFLLLTLIPLLRELDTLA